MHLLKEIAYVVMLIIELVYLVTFLWKMGSTLRWTMYGDFRGAAVTFLETVTTGVMIVGIDRICKWLRP